MQKIIDYTVIRAGAANELAGLVVTGIAGGWQPIGGVSTGGIDRSTHLQAMVKYEEPETLTVDNSIRATGLSYARP